MRIEPETCNQAVFESTPQYNVGFEISESELNYIAQNYSSKTDRILSGLFFGCDLVLDTKEAHVVGVA
jgi:hypothetical protein